MLFSNNMFYFCEKHRKILTLKINIASIINIFSYLQKLRSFGIIFLC